MKMELTDFQIACEMRLAKAMQRAGKSIINRKIEGTSETFITGNIKNRDIAFWIYADGADFETPHEHPVFEKPDYDSLDALAEEFIKSLEKATEK
jgi:hypothetical protein